MVLYASSQNAVKLFLKRFTAASGTDVEIVQKFLFLRCPSSCLMERSALHISIWTRGNYRQKR